MSNIDKISQKAARLNEVSDILNEQLFCLERDLGDTHVGITAWLDNVLLSSRDEGRFKEGFQLGYAKVGGSWRIAARQVYMEKKTGSDRSLDEWKIKVCMQKETVSDSPLSEWKIQEVTHIMPLVQASRIVRIEAVGHLGSLLKTLEQKTDESVENMEKANRQLQDVCCAING